MKNFFGVLLIFIVLSASNFAVQAQTFRIEAGYSQPNIYSNLISDRTFQGINLGVNVELEVPNLEFLSLHTGISYHFMFSDNSQRSRFGTPLNDSIRIQTQGHQLRIPIYLQASQTVFRVLRGTVFAGPSIHIGLAMPQEITTRINPDFWDLVSLNGYYRLNETADLYSDRVHRFNLSLDAGLALDWWRLQLRGGYSFGVLNLNKWQQPVDAPIEFINVSRDQMRLRQSGWFVSLGYRF